MQLIVLVTNPAIIGTLALFLSVIWMLKDQTDSTRPLLVFALALNLFFGFLLTVFMSREGGLLPWKFDPVLAALDRAIGVQSSTIALPLQGWCRIPLIVVYQLMVPMMIGWFFVTRAGNPRTSIVLAYVAELVAAPVLYAIFPACGPVYLLGAQWLHPDPVQAAAVKLVGMPNAFPSLHVGTAFVFVLLAPGRVWRAVSVGFLALTAMATLSTGEHYVIDLVAGLAFGCFAAGVAQCRVRGAMLYLGVVLGWSLTVRFGYWILIGHPWLPRLFALLTIALAAAAVFKDWSFADEGDCAMADA